MLSEAGSSIGIARGHLSLIGFLRMTLDPAIAVATYAVVLAACGLPFTGRDLLLCVIVFSLMFPGRLPSLDEGRGLFRPILASWLTVVGILACFGWATGYLFDFAIDALATWAVATPFAIFGAHRLLPAIAPRVLDKEGVRTAVVVGGNALGQRLAEQFRNKPLLGVRFEGFFDDRGAERLGPDVAADLKGRLADLPEYVKRRNVGAIFITLPMASQPRTLDLLESLYDTTSSIYFVPDIFVYDLIQARVDDVGGLPIVAVCESPFYGVSGLVKRIEDLAIASLLLLLASPVMLAIAIGVKLTSPGPVLFKQRRYGLDGREILVCKFRSMRVMEDGDAIPQAQRNDPRVTPFGAFLRKTSLDELPQLFNVLQGTMSIVGPRPHAVAHNEIYRKLIRGYMIRHKVKPGLTGLAQVSGYRGETDSVEKMQGRVDYDLHYLRNWSVRLDLAIIVKTIVVVLTGRNAY